MIKLRKLVIDIYNQYTLQGDEFSKAIINDTQVPYPIEDALNNMKVIDAIFRSKKNINWEKI